MLSAASEPVRGGGGAPRAAGEGARGRAEARPPAGERPPPFPPPPDPAPAGAETAADGERAAEQASPHIVHRERGLGEADLAGGVLDRRQLRMQGEAVVGELVLARQLRRGEVADRQLPLEVEPALAERAPPVGEAARPAPYRPRVDE